MGQTPSCSVRAQARSAAHKAAASHIATACAVLFGIGAIGLGAVLIFTDELPLSGAGSCLYLAQEPVRALPSEA
jgi:hypothetical protein